MCTKTFDIRDVFDTETGPIYWDQGHVSDRGNSIIAKSLDPDNKDFPEGLIMNQKVNGNKLELYFKSSSALESLFNTVDEVLSMIDKTNKTLDKVK